MFDTRLPDMSNNYKKFDKKDYSYIDFENYRRKDIQYSFNDELQNLKNQLKTSNEKIDELNNELNDLKIELETLKAIKDE